MAGSLGGDHEVSVDKRLIVIGYCLLVNRYWGEPDARGQIRQRTD
jgi:hypothetical protein